MKEYHTHARNEYKKVKSHGETLQAIAKELAKMAEAQKKHHAKYFLSAYAKDLEEVAIGLLNYKEDIEITDKMKAIARKREQERKKRKQQNK